jgi:hypothetical protein
MSNFAQDMAIKHAWGLTLDQWERATDKERRDMRDRVTQAPHFQGVSR